MKLTLLCKVILVGIFLHSSAIAAKILQEQDLIYKITYLGKEHPNCLDFSVDIKGNKEGKINIRFPQFADNFVFKAKQGTLFYSMPQDRRFQINVDSNVDMEASYQICVSNQIRDVERPIIERDFFHFISESLLIMPDESLDITKQISIEFLNFPRKYSIATNHFVNKRRYEIKTTIRDLSRSIMAGGDVDIISIDVANRPVHFMLNGKWSMFNHSALIENVKKIIQTQRNLFIDYDFPHFVMILMKNSMPEGEGGILGSLYGNVLSMVITDDKPKNTPFVYGILSHELFHAWLGNKIKPPLPQGNLQWFFEGVNDFYGWQLALEAGLLSENHYIEYYNKLVKEYMLSPFKNATNQELAEAFSLRNLAGRTAMIRGHIVFMELLNTLNQQGKNRKPLDAALKEIIDRSLNENAISESDLHQIFIKHIGKENWNIAAEGLIMGKPIILSKALFKSKVTLKNQQFETPNVGFNLETLVKERKIKELVAKSQGSTAGLKEGTKVIGYGLDITSPSSQVYITVEEKGKPKTISFTPNKIKKLIPQYSET